MALDQIPSTGKCTRFKILHNIGSAFFRLGKFSDAIQSYETILGGHPDVLTAYNLILCHYALGDAEKMRRGFQKLVTIPQTQSDSCRVQSSMPSNDNGPTVDVAGTQRIEAECVDGLSRECKQRVKEANSYIMTAARLIAPELKAPDDDMIGYKLIIDTLKGYHDEYVESRTCLPRMIFVQVGRSDRN